MLSLRRLTLAGPALFLGLFFLYPLWQILQHGIDAEAWRWMGSDYVRRNLGLAFQQAIWSLLLTLALAVPLAYFYHRRRIRFARWHLALHAAPFVLPVFVVVGAVRGMFGPFGWVSNAVGTDLLAIMGPMGAVVLAHAYYNYGFAARLIHDALERRPNRLEQAAATLGASRRETWLRVTLPLLAPALGAVALLVFLFCFTSFGVVLLLGDGAINTLETLLYRNTLGVIPRINRAAALGILQLAINMVVLFVYMRLHRREVDGRAAPPVATKSAPWVAHGLLVLGLLPAATVLVGGFRLDDAWSLEPWRSLLDATHPNHRPGFSLWAAIDRSMFYALWSSALSVVLVAMMAYAKGRGRKVLEYVAALPLGTSSLLVGLGMVVAFGSGAWLDLRGQLIQIVIAHALVAFPFVARAMLPAFDAHNRRYDQAASVLGASPWQVARRIHWPLLRRPFAVSVGFAVAISLGDFGASLLLMRPDNMSLAVWIGAHNMPFQEMAHAQMLALSGALMLLAALALVSVEAVAGRSYARD